MEISGLGFDPGLHQYPAEGRHAALGAILCQREARARCGRLSDPTPELLHCPPGHYVVFLAWDEDFIGTDDGIPRPAEDFGPGQDEGGVLLYDHSCRSGHVVVLYIPSGVHDLQGPRLPRAWTGFGARRTRPAPSLIGNRGSILLAKDLAKHSSSSWVA